MVAGLMAGSLLMTAGCKTSQDATAAATQMSATARSLCDYYTSLKTILDNTDQLYRINEQLYSKPYSAENQQLLQKNKAELDKRAQLASDFSDLAAQFAKLTGSTAPADVAASGTKLETEVDSLGSLKPTETEQNAIKTALQFFVTAIQEHKEREAARAMDDSVEGLANLFIKESPAYNSIQQVYARIAGNLAGNLVDRNATDNFGVLKVALDPFGLVSSGSPADLNSKLAPLAKQQITAKETALDNSYTKATDAMTKSLQEMSRRIHLVAGEKPMDFRAPPLTLSTVEAWAAQVMATGSSAAPTASTTTTQPAQ